MDDFNADSHYQEKELQRERQHDREIAKLAEPVHVDVEPYNPVWGAVQSIKEHDE